MADTEESSGIEMCPGRLYSHTTVTTLNSIMGQETVSRYNTQSSTPHHLFFCSSVIGWVQFPICHGLYVNHLWNSVPITWARSQGPGRRHAAGRRILGSLLQHGRQEVRLRKRWYCVGDSRHCRPCNVKCVF